METVKKSIFVILNIYVLIESYSKTVGMGSMLCEMRCGVASEFCLSSKYVAAVRVFDDVDGTETILAFANEHIIIQCETDLPMIYCGFLHPTGIRYSGFNDGQCAIKLKVAKQDDGEWMCHIGRKTARLETTKKIRLRVVNQVAAIQPNITAMYGKPITIHCATTNGLVPMSYCRFEPPKGNPFSIDSTVNLENSILGNYYYPHNRSLDRGDCAVTIRQVKHDDAGIWTCGAGLDDGKEYTDTIRVDVQGLHKISTTSATGVTFGGISVAVVLGLLGVVVWKKRRCLRRRKQPESQVIYIEDLGRRRSSLQLGQMVAGVMIQSSSERSLTPLISKL